jgi:WhiB family redox-sensing transcriptional regulator
MTPHLEEGIDDLVVLDWRDLAACASHDPDLFFPAGETGPAAHQIELAKEICGGCDVAAECLEYAIESNQTAGIWAGLTEDERRPVRRRWLAERRRHNS